MDIYISNIKLPKDEPGAFQVIVMYVGADGKLRAECEGTHEVTAVPPHGCLIDESEFFARLDNGIKTISSLPLPEDFVALYTQLVTEVKEEIEKCRTVIPESRGASDG